MIHHKVAQGSAEWLRLRLGIPTASEFERIITPAKWEPTKADTRRRYLIDLLTERIIGESLAQVSTAAMEHGHEWEPRARAAYEMLRGVDVELCGLCTTDDGKIGASPDGFVGEDGMVEIKTPASPQVHVGYLSDPETLKAFYWVQVQGQLYVTGRKWVDLLSYFSGIEMVCLRIEPHAEFQAKLADTLKTFVNDLDLLVDRAKTKGWIKEREESQEFISDEDVNAILAARQVSSVSQSWEVTE